LNDAKPATDELQDLEAAQEQATDAHVVSAIVTAVLPVTECNQDHVAQVNPEPEVVGMNRLNRSINSFNEHELFGIVAGIFLTIYLCSQLLFLTLVYSMKGTFS
jgi:hypothetical protein